MRVFVGVSKMFLCQMAGMPGVGKSTLARRICNVTNAVLLDLDVIKSSIMNSFENDIDFKFAGKVAYQMIFSLVDSNLEMGNSVIIDSPCGYEIQIEQGVALAEKYNIQYKFVECYLELEQLPELNRRRTKREILPSQQFNVPIDEEAFRKGIGGSKRPIDHEYLMINTIQEVERYIGDVIEYLNR